MIFRRIPYAPYDPTDLRMATPKEEPEAGERNGGCRCWTNDAAVGHEGHCCFLRDDRDRKINDGWREIDDICHVPPNWRGMQR